MLLLRVFEVITSAAHIQHITELIYKSEFMLVDHENNLPPQRDYVTGGSIYVFLFVL